MLLFSVFTAGPVISSLYMSFTDIKSRDLRSPFAVGFIGLENYAHVFADERFRKAALNTAYFVIIGVPLTLGVALAAALALNKGITKFRTVFRVGYYTPVVTSIVAVAVVWRFLLREDVGLVNTVLRWVGINGPDWLGSTTFAMPSLIAMASWRNFGTAMIIFLAGLQSVPVLLHEAAAIDGASSWQQFRYITVPLLRPTILFVTVTTGIGYLQFFEEPFVMTNGGAAGLHHLDVHVHLRPVRFRQLRIRLCDELRVVRDHRLPHCGPVPIPSFQHLTGGESCSTSRDPPPQSGCCTPW